MIQDSSLPQTERKTDSRTVPSCKALTTNRKKVETMEINQQAVSPCTCKRLCEASITPEVIREKITQILSEPSTPETQRLLGCLDEWVGAEWKQHRLKLVNRISKLKYLQPSLMGENYSTIEKEILIEWRKNSFLHGCQLLWNHIFRTQKFKKQQKLLQFYNTIRQVVAHLSFILFEPCLQALRKRKFPVQHRLFNFTAVTIITSSKEWKQIVEKVIKPHLLQNAPSFSENFDLRSLKVSPEIIDFNSQKRLFPKTAASLADLSNSYTMKEIVTSLNSYRENMLGEVRSNIQDWCSRNGKSSKVILEKDDILACIIYSLVAHKLDNIGMALGYIRFLFNGELQNILRQSKVDCYLTDLFGVYQYLTTPVVVVSFQQIQKQQQTKEELISV